MTTTTRTFIRNVPLGKDSGKTFDVPLHDLLPAAVVAVALDASDPKAKLLRELLLVGTSRIFVDCQASAKTDAERLGACEKKLDAWREGEMLVRGGGAGETVEGEAKRLFIADYMSKTGKSETLAKADHKGKLFDDIIPAIARKIAEAKAGEGATEEAIKAAAQPLLEAASAKWRAAATASLEAKAAARAKSAPSASDTALLESML